MIPDASSLAPLLAGEQVSEVKRLHGDGSARVYYRVRTDRRAHVLLAGTDPLENAAYVRIARHLAARGVRVPEVRAVDEARGWILLEDLGDGNLFGALRRAGGDAERLALYAPVLDLLVRMQVDGAQDFTLATGFADAPYGPALMVEHEGFYFVREFAEGVLGIETDRAGLGGEFERLARRASEAPGGYFLHRDFQSRNLQGTPGDWAVIDFQGARPGPLAYDAAALILDPYAANAKSLRAALLGNYLSALRTRGIDSETVERSFTPIGAFRLLQALGAYAKLGGRLGKPGFLEHAAPALEMLSEQLAEAAEKTPALAALVERCRDLWARKRLTHPTV